MPTPRSSRPPGILCLFARPHVVDLAGGVPQDIVLRYRKGVALLGFLAAHADRVLRRETLAELLWSDLPASGARANLRGVLADLLAALRRAGLHDMVECERDWLAWRSQPSLTVDVSLAQATHPDPVLLRHVADLAARQTWLDGAEDGTSEDFRDWLTGQRSHVARLGQPGGGERRAARPGVAPAALPSAAPAATGAAAVAADQAPQIATVTLLRVELASTGATDAPADLSPVAALLRELQAEAAFFGGQLVASDDAGATFVFGMESQHTGQRWQALRTASVMQAQLGARLALRIGVTAGRTLVRRTLTPEVLGWRRRLADRLALTAEDGEVVLDGSFADLAPGFGAPSAGRQRFRGIDREFTLYRRALADAPALVLPPGGDFAAGFFGNEPLLLAVRQAFEGVRADGEVAAVAVTGEAGMGKTRLAWELARRTREAGAPVFWIGALPEAVQLPWRGLHGLFSSLLAGAGPADRRLDHLLKTLGAALSAESRLAILGFTSAHSLPQGLRGALIEGFCALLRGDGRRCALVVVDDAQWLDAASADVLLRVARHAGPTVQWLLTCRAGQAHPLPLPGLRSLAMQPMPDATAEAILDTLPDADLLTPQVRRGRIANARGLPLYLVAESVPSGAGSHFEEFCQALVNRLGPARAAMQAAAVLGMLFDCDDLAGLAGAEDASQACERALASGLLVQRGAGRLSFFHPRLREYLLAVTPGEVAERHARHAATRMVERGRHAEAALLWQQVGHVGHARAAWFAAAMQAMAADDFASACDSADQFAALGYPNGAEGIAARLVHARCLVARDGYGSARAHQIALAVYHAPAADMGQLDQDTAFGALALAYLGSSSQGPTEGLSYARRLQAAATTLAQQHAACWALGNTLFWRGDFAEARACLDTCIAHGKCLTQRERMAYFPSDMGVFARAELGWLLWFTGDAIGSSAMLAAARAMAAQSTTRQDDCIAGCFSGFVAWCAGDYPALATHAAMAGRVAGEESFGFWQSVAGLLAALARAHTGQPIDPAAVAGHGEAMLAGYAACAPTAQWMVADALATAGDGRAAAACIALALVEAETSEHQFSRLGLWQLLATVQRRQGHQAEADVAAMRASERAEEMGALGWHVGASATTK